MGLLKIIFSALFGLFCLFLLQENLEKTQNKARENLSFLDFKDGSRMQMRSRFQMLDGKEFIDIHILFWRNEAKEDRTWETDIGSIWYIEEMGSVFGLVDQTNDEIYIYTPCNNTAVVLDKKNGKILKKDKSDETLRFHPTLTPLKLRKISPSTGTVRPFPNVP